MRIAPFNVRSVRALGAAVALASTVALAARGCTIVRYWQGFKDLRIGVVIVDAKTGAPVPGAIVRLTPFTGPKSSAITSPDGTASLVYRFSTSGTSSWMGSTGAVIFHSCDIHVEAPGYIALNAMLSDYLGAAQETDKPDPPRVRVPISRCEAEPTP